MEINFEDYLSDEEKKEIIINEYRTLVQRKMKTENDLKRILSNVSFEVFYKIVDDCFDGISKATIKEQIDRIISDPKSYNIFKRPDAWDRETNSAYRHMQEVINNHKPKITKKISDLMDEQVIKTCKSDIKDLVETILSEHIKSF